MRALNVIPRIWFVGQLLVGLVGGAVIVVAIVGSVWFFGESSDTRLVSQELRREVLVEPEKNLVFNIWFPNQSQKNTDQRVEVAGLIAELHAYQFVSMIPREYKGFIPGADVYRTRVCELEKVDGRWSLTCYASRFHSQCGGKKLVALEQVIGELDRFLGCDDDTQGKAKKTPMAA